MSFKPTRIVYRSSAEHSCSIAVVIVQQQAIVHADSCTMAANNNALASVDDRAVDDANDAHDDNDHRCVRSDFCP